MFSGLYAGSDGPGDPKLPPCLLRLTHMVSQRSLQPGWDSQAGDRYAWKSLSEILAQRTKIVCFLGATAG